MTKSEQLERVAREVMGWKRGREVGGLRDEAWYAFNSQVRGWVHTLGWMGETENDGWDPFVDARADLQVLERMRELWTQTHGDEWEVFLKCFRSILDTRAKEKGYSYGYDSAVAVLAAFSAMLTEYQVGDYARATLDFIKEMEV